MKPQPSEKIRELYERLGKLKAEYNSQFNKRQFEQAERTKTLILEVQYFIDQEENNG